MNTFIDRNFPKIKRWILSLLPIIKKSSQSSGNSRKFPSFCTNEWMSIFPLHQLVFLHFITFPTGTGSAYQNGRHRNNAILLVFTRDLYEFRQILVRPGFIIFSSNCSRFWSFWTRVCIMFLEIPCRSGTHLQRTAKQTKHHRAAPAPSLSTVSIRVCFSETESELRGR